MKWMNQEVSDLDNTALQSGWVAIKATFDKYQEAAESLKGRTDDRGIYLRDNLPPPAPAFLELKAQFEAELAKRGLQP